MGEAKKRVDRIAAFRGGLTPDELIVADIALAVHRKFLVPNEASGMCYRMAFFLAEYLADRHGLQAEPTVGYVSDGEGDIMSSHAWLTYNGKKTDISLTRTQFPEVPTGALLILDHEVSTGSGRYTYHEDRSPEAVKAAIALMEDPHVGRIVRHKEAEHAQMKAREGSSALRRAYLDMAPDGFTFDRLAVIIDTP